MEDHYKGKNKQEINVVKDKQVSKEAQLMFHNKVQITMILNENGSYLERLKI